MDVLLILYAEPSWSLHGLLKGRFWLEVLPTTPHFLRSRLFLWSKSGHFQEQEALPALWHSMGQVTLPALLPKSSFLNPARAHIACTGQRSLWRNLDQLPREHEEAEQVCERSQLPPGAQLTGLRDLWLPDPTSSGFAPHHQQAWLSRPQGNTWGQAAQAGQTQPSLPVLGWALSHSHGALFSTHVYFLFFFMIS